MVCEQGSRGLTGVMYDRDGNRKPFGPKQAFAWAFLFPARLALEVVILPVRFVKLIDDFSPLHSKK